MTRRHLAFACEGSTLVGTLDAGGVSGPTGLLVVSGGNEVRAGAWGGQAQLAARLAGHGYPVFRLDRRGVGDSEGENGGFRSSGPDIAAAIAAFRTAAPNLSRVVAFGNCDAASALALHGASLALDALVLANPWTFDGETDEGSAMPGGAIRARYLRKLADPREIGRLLTGGVNLRKLAGGLREAATPAQQRSALAAEMQDGLDRFGRPVTILLASGDRTALAFAAAWNPSDPRVRRLDSASHSFSGDAAQDWLFARLVEALA